MPFNPYMSEIERNLPRVLALIDGDATSTSYGMGDRYHWAWGLIDFGNGTFQGVAHGLARLWKSGLWPYSTPKADFLKRISSLYEGARTLTSSTGSLEEAFPNEGSYCVTALVAFDLLCTLDLLSEDINSSTYEGWKSIIKPMIEYLVRADETHAIISNHLATAVAALVLWVELTQDHSAEEKAVHLLDRILDNQSTEGWFKEYDGADPGYQSLCTYYLAFIHLRRPDLNLEEPLNRSIEFLWYFAHPDGSFGGLYGSRCTRFYIPAGVLALSKENKKAHALTEFLAKSISERTVVTLSSIDEPNLIPVFNSYCWAATLMSEQVLISEEAPKLPALVRDTFNHYFAEAGLYVDRGQDHYTIINTDRGGIIYHYSDEVSAKIDSGVVVKNKNQNYGSSQSRSSVKFSIDKENITITSSIGPMPKSRPRPWQFIVLRLLGVSLFKSFLFREWTKQFLVRFLISDKKPWPVKNIRKIELGKNLIVKDETLLKKGYEVVENVGNFVPIHMASQGYWQIQDENRLNARDP